MIGRRRQSCSHEPRELGQIGGSRCREASTHLDLGEVLLDRHGNRVDGAVASFLERNRSQLVAGKAGDAALRRDKEPPSAP